MGRLSTGLVFTTIASMLAVVTFGGCSADGTAGGEPPSSNASPTDPGNRISLPPRGDDGEVEDDAGATDSTDAGKKPTNPRPDAGSKDASADGAPPPGTSPVAGKSCPTPGQRVLESCGRCGSKSIVCELGAGGGIWGAWSDCKAETGDCSPGDTETELGGNCTSRTRTCTPTCTWKADTSWMGSGVCSAGSAEYIPSGCPVGRYKKWDCSTTCAYIPPSSGSACVAPPTQISISTNVLGVASTVVTLDSSNVLPKLTAGTCPTKVATPAVSVPSAHVTIKNPLPRPVTVTIYNAISGQLGGTPTPPEEGGAYETMLVAYPPSVGIPTTEDARNKCTAASTSSDTTLTDGKFAVLKDGKVTIGPGATIAVLVAARNVFNAQTPEKSTGPIKLAVRTDLIAP